jgi:hypothetical protein
MLSFVTDTNGGVCMVTRLFMELRRIFADLASTLILGKNKDAADIALRLAEKSRALAEELAK